MIIIQLKKYNDLLDKYSKELLEKDFAVEYIDDKNKIL
jgi:hypothetical protein